MGSWTSDRQLLALMRGYVVATNRLEVLEARSAVFEAGVRVDTDELRAVRAAQRDAARSFEEALLARGWQIPGVSAPPGAQDRDGAQVVVGF